MSRAQSTVLGTIMLVAVVAVTVTLAGAFTILSVTDADDGPVVDLSATVTASDVALVHDGGDSLESDGLAVHLRVDGSETIHPFSDGTVDGDGRFEPGERWAVAHGLSLDGDERVRVLVVDERANAVVLDATRTVE